MALLQKALSDAAKPEENGVEATPAPAAEVVENSEMKPISRQKEKFSVSMAKITSYGEHLLSSPQRG